LPLLKVWRHLGLPGFNTKDSKPALAASVFGNPVDIVDMMSHGPSDTPKTNEVFCIFSRKSNEDNLWSNNCVMHRSNHDRKEI